MIEDNTDHEGIAITGAVGLLFIGRHKTGSTVDDQNQ